MKLLLKISSSFFCCFYFFFLIFLFLGNGHILLTSSHRHQQPSNVSKVSTASIDSNDDYKFEDVSNQWPSIPTTDPQTLIPSSTSASVPTSKTPRLVLLPPNVPKLATDIFDTLPTIPSIAKSKVSNSKVSKKWSVNAPTSSVHLSPPASTFQAPIDVTDNYNKNIEHILVQNSGLPPSVNVPKYQNQRQELTRKSGERMKTKSTTFHNAYQTLPSNILVQRHGHSLLVKNNNNGVKYGHAGLTMVPVNGSSESNSNDFDVTIATPSILKNSTGNLQSVPEENASSTNENGLQLDIPTTRTPTTETPTTIKPIKYDSEDTGDAWSFQSRLLDDTNGPKTQVTTGTIQDYNNFIKLRNYSDSGVATFKLEAISEPFAGNTYRNITPANNVSTDHVADILDRFRSNFSLTQNNEHNEQQINPHFSRSRPQLPTTFRPHRHSYEPTRGSISHGTSQGSSSNRKDENIESAEDAEEEEETETSSFGPQHEKDRQSAADLFMKDFDSKYGRHDKWINDNDLNSSSSDDNKTETGTDSGSDDGSVSKVDPNGDRKSEMNENIDQSSSPTEQPPIKLEGVRIRQVHRGHDHGGHDDKGHGHDVSSKVTPVVRLSPTEMTKLNSVRINGAGNERPSSTLSSKASANIPAPKTHGHNPPVNRIPVRGHPRFKPQPPPTTTQSSSDGAKDGDFDNEQPMIKELPAKNSGGNQREQYQYYNRPDQVNLNHQDFGQQNNGQGQRQQQPYYLPQTFSNPGSNFEQYPRYIIDDSLMQKLTASGSNNDKNVENVNQSVDNDEPTQKSNHGVNPDVIGEAEGGGFGVYPQHYPGSFGGHVHGHIPPPLLPPPPPIGAPFPGLPVIQTKVTCCKTYYPPPIPPAQVVPLYPPPPGIIPHPYYPVGAGSRFHSQPMTEMMSNEISGNGGDAVGTASSGSMGSMAKADGGSFDTLPYVGGGGGAHVGGGIHGPVPGFGPHVIPPGYKFGDSYCFHEPILPHPLYLKQVKLNKLLFPFIWKKRLLFNFG